MKLFQTISLVLSFIIVFVICPVMSSHGENKPKPIFQDGFDEGLKKWNTAGSSIEISLTEASNKYLKIYRDNRRGFTYISKEFVGYKGTLVFEANIKSEDVITGNKNFHRGKFQAVVVVNGHEVDWPDDDFKGTFPWMPRRFQVFDLTGKETVILRIGLQNAKGTIFVDDIKVHHVQ